MATAQPSPRSYTMRARAASSAQTADTILEAVYAQFRTKSYDDVSQAMSPTAPASRSRRSCAASARRTGCSSPSR